MSDTLTAGSEVGRYVVKRKLAEGGMAELFLCTAVGPEGFEKEVVLKRVRSFLASDEGFMKMFVDEARLASRLNHANVVQIFDFAKHQDTYFIAMEFVHGVSLWDLRRRCRELSVPFPPTLVAEIGAAVARGLHYAHTLTDKGKPLGIVHRDVTPHNVLLSFDGAIKLTDFGIAKAGTSSSYTAPGMLKGKFAYMSPEQGRGDKVDARTDVFALGIVLWEMLTGGRLFEGDSDVAVLRAVQESFIAPPARLNPEVPPELDQVVLKALARKLDERFQSAQELERALANFVLRHATSVEDTSVSVFLSALFRDELEAARQAEYVRPDGTKSTAKTPVAEPELGHTAIVQRDHATPSAPAERPKTALQPGVGRPRGPLEDEDPSDVRTDRMTELKGPRAQTAQLPAGAQAQKVLLRDSLLKEMSEASGQVKAQLEQDRLKAALAAPVSVVAALSPEPSATVKAPRSLTPWVLTACAALGAIGAVGVMVFNSRRPPAEPGPPLVLSPPPTAPAPSPVAEPATAPAAALPVPAEPTAAAIEAPSGPDMTAPAEPTGRQPLEPSVPQPAARPVEAKAPGARVTKAPSPAASVGWLRVAARPYADITIDGKKFPAQVEGEQKIPLRPGLHQVVLTHPKRSEEFPVMIEAGKTQDHTFVALPGK